MSLSYTKLLHNKSNFILKYTSKTKKNGIENVSSEYNAKIAKLKKHAVFTILSSKSEESLPS